MGRLSAQRESPRVPEAEGAAVAEEVTQVGRRRRERVRRLDGQPLSLRREGEPPPPGCWRQRAVFMVETGGASGWWLLKANACTYTLVVHALNSFAEVRGDGGAGSGDSPWLPYLLAGSGIQTLCPLIRRRLDSGHPRPSSGLFKPPPSLPFLLPTQFPRGSKSSIAKPHFY